MRPTTKRYPRILTVASALPPYRYSQETMLEPKLERILGAEWPMNGEKSHGARLIKRLFAASQVEQRC